MPNDCLSKTRAADDGRVLPLADNHRYRQQQADDRVTSAATGALRCGSRIHTIGQERPSKPRRKAVAGSARILER